MHENLKKTKYRQSETVKAYRGAVSKTTAERDSFSAGNRAVSTLFNDPRFGFVKSCLDKEIEALQEKRNVCKDICTSEFDYVKQSIECDSKIEILRKILGMQSVFSRQMKELNEKIAKLKKEMGGLDE